MRVFITGANGFVGTNLSRVLTNAGHSVSALVRSEKKAEHFPRGVTPVLGESTKPGDWQKAVAGHNVLINLAGTSIFSRWTLVHKQLMRDSRILTTKNLVDAIAGDSASQVTLVSTSAVGYYGCTEDEELDENSPAGSDFLATLAKDWETEAFRAREKSSRVVIMRFGVVLGRDGGALEEMVRPFRFFVGGPLGSGRQWFSWVHIQDLCRAVLFVMDHPEVDGPLNFTAPGSVRNRDLARAIGKVMHRPSFMPAPGFMLRLILGEFGQVILEGQRVVPRALTSKGFSFDFPEIHGALGNLLQG